MKVYAVEDITKKLKQDNMTEYLEKFQFDNNPTWVQWLESPDVCRFEFKSGKDDREFEDDITIVGIPIELVDILSHIDSLKSICDNPAILERTKMENEESIKDLENRLWGLSYRYTNEGYGRNYIYIFWIWSNGYFTGIYKGKKSSIIKEKH